jgi:hypothetical protein
MPSAANSKTAPPRSRIRITTLSPCIVGTVETRKSTSLPRMASLMRPSCGSRRSAMFSFDMILTRETMAAVSRPGGVSTSCSRPSTR